MPSSPAPLQFILGAFDPEQWCPVLEARFHLHDLNALRSILGEQAQYDPQLWQSYTLDRDELAAIVDRFGVSFDPQALTCQEPEVFVSRRRRLDPPYLVHTGYELPLLLDGRKKLARMSDGYPPMRFEGEDRYDRWVAQGLLYKEEVLEAFDPRPRDGPVFGRSTLRQQVRSGASRRAS